MRRRALLGTPWIWLPLQVMAFAIVLGLNQDDVNAQETRTLRIVKITGSAGHPGGTFSGTVSSGVGFFDLQLEPGEGVGSAISRAMPVDYVGVVEHTRPAGWSLDGYALVPDSDGEAECTLSLNYGSANVIPPGSTPYVVCVKNSYEAGSGVRPVRVAVTTSTPSPVDASFSISLSTGAQAILSLSANETSSIPVDFEIPTSGVEVHATASPSYWIPVGLAIVPDADGTAQCMPGMDSVGGQVPAGVESYLVCLEYAYYPPGNPRSLGLGVLALSSEHPGGSFSIRIDGIAHVVTLGASQPSSGNLSVTAPPPASDVEFLSLTPGWSVIGYLLSGFDPLRTCDEVVPFPPIPGRNLVLPAGSQPFLVCVAAVHLPTRAVVPAVVRDGSPWLMTWHR